MANFIRPEYLRKLPPYPDNAAFKEMAANFQERQNADRAYALGAAYGTGDLLAQALAEDPVVYGDKLTERLAAHLGVAPDELEREHTLCCVFDPEFMATCQQRKTAKGNLISLPHLRALAEVRDPQKRQEILEEIYAKDLTVEALRGLIQDDAEIIKVHYWRSTEPEPQTPLSVAMELTRVMMKLKKGLKFWKDGLIASIKEDGQNRLYTILLHRLNEAVKQVEPNLALLTEINSELAAARDYLRENKHEPQDPDPDEQWVPQPKA